jgi:hypothetical protein
MATRLGLNCTLSYPDAQGTTRTYQIRAGAIGHGIEMIFTESQARTVRAFYPHRTAMEQFSIVVLLKNWDERTSFVNWLSSYANYAIDPDIVQSAFPWMQVTVPSRSFTQYGVPLTGYEWGAHTGQMMFTPQVLFEAAQSPGSQPGIPTLSDIINKWSAFATDPAIQYFYPFGTQLSGSQQPMLPSSVGNVNYNGSPAAYNNQLITNQGPGAPPVIAGPATPTAPANINGRP